MPQGNAIAAVRNGYPDHYRAIISATARWDAFLGNSWVDWNNVSPKFLAQGNQCNLAPRIFLLTG